MIDDPAKNTRSGIGTAEYALPRDTQRAMDVMLFVADQVCTVYEDINEALQNRDTARALLLQKDQIRIGESYRQHTQMAVRRAEEFKAMDPGFGERLQEKHSRFMAVAPDVQKGLNRMIGASRRLNARIMNSARKSAGQRGLNYTAAGVLSGEDKPVVMNVSETA